MLLLQGLVSDVNSNVWVLWKCERSWSQSQTMRSHFHHRLEALECKLKAAIEEEEKAAENRRAVVDMKCLLEK